MVTETRTTDTASSGMPLCLLLVALTGAANGFVQSRGLINPDVAFLAWTAAKVLGPPVFGMDIYEVNLPLAFMIYSPAAFLAPMLGHVPAIQVWITMLACLSVLVFWQACESGLRLPLTITLALFITFVFPGQFGQREQVALMLTAPYVAGPCRNRGWAVLSGVMAGVGFAIKPYFLIPLIFVFATRRRVRTEEWAIAATGAAYALSLVLFFQPYLFHFMPLVRATYWAAHLDKSLTWELTGLLLLAAVPFALAGTPQPAARGFIAATLGYALAALIQLKGFSYHFHAAWGFLALFLVVRCFNPRRIVAICSAVMLLVLGYFVSTPTIAWFIRQDEAQKSMRELLPEIDGSPSYLSFALSSFPGFPTALYTTSDFKGMAIWPIFISAAREASAGPLSQERARRLTLDQAITELERQPALVIVARKDPAGGWNRATFDLLSWFKTDAGFRAAWDHYRYDKTIGDYDLYRRKP